MKLLTRMRYWLRRPRLESDLTEEIRLHREMLEEQLVREGTPAVDARFATDRRFGNPTVVAEQTREVWSLIWIDALLRYLHFAWRLLARQPMFAAAAILTVAFGVGANTAVVSVLETVLLNPLGLRHADRVIVVRETLPKLQMRKMETSAVEYREIREMTDVFSAVAAMEGRAWTAVSGGEATRLVGRAVTPDFFRVFGEFPSEGRFFTEEDRDSVVLSDQLWRSWFGSDPAIVGRLLTLDDRPHRIVGIAPPDFRFPAGVQIWTPLLIEPHRLLESRRGWEMRISIFARVKDGVTQAQAFDRATRYFTSNADFTKHGYEIELDPFPRYIAGDLQQPLWLLWGAALLLLFTGCANIAGLLLARVSNRRKEIAIRISVGATSRQIVRQLLLESLLLGAFGGIVGLSIAAVAISLLTGLTIPRRAMLAMVSLDGRLLLYGFGLALLSGLLFGFAPAIQLLRQSQSSEMARSRRKWFQDLYVTAEVAGAFVLIVMTFLLLRSLWLVERIQVGFDTHNVTSAFFLKPKNDPGFYDRLEIAVRSSPSVQSAALVNPVPFAGANLTSGFNIKNREHRAGEALWHGEAFQITPDYFHTLGIPLLRGRNFADSDTARSPLVCVIDSKLAERFFAGMEPIGQEIGMYGGWARIVGVVATIRGGTLEEGSRPSVYYSFAQVPLPSISTAGVVVRSTAPAGAVIRAAVRQANTSVPVYDVKSLDDRIGDSLGLRRMLATLLSSFGAISLLLAILGVYGVIAQVVSERTREIGIRMALGARPTQILSQFMRRGLQSGLVGLILGFAAVAYAQRWLADMLYRVEPFDPVTFVSASVGVLSLLLAAVWWPARRAARIDPQQALRHE